MVFYYLVQFVMWIHTLILKIIGIGICICTWLLKIIRNRLQTLRRHLLPIWVQVHVVNLLPSCCSRAILGLRYKVECYGQGNVHKTILTDSPAPDGGLKTPCVLFVYKVSREVEDLRNALHSIQMEQKIKREDICAVILLEKVLSKCDKPVNVDHGGMFDDRSVVVRILWEKQSCDRVQKGSRYHEAMGKVIHSINERQHE